MIRIIVIFTICLLSLSSTEVWAKKKKKADPAAETESSMQQQPSPALAAQRRIKNLSSDDQRLYDSLSQEQKDKISLGQIDIGFNAWMVKLALGEPLYGTEHHPTFTDFEEVWLYAKPEVTKSVKENKIIDAQTNWPTIHRITTSKKCNIDDFFVLWDRGVVASVNQARKHNINGTCTIETEEAYLPIVDGKAVEPK